MAVDFSAEHRLKILKLAAEICGERGFGEDGAKNVIAVYRQLCEALTAYPVLPTVDTAWVEKLETSEAHFGGVTKAADKIGCARSIFYRMKRMSEPSATYASQVDRIYAQIAGQVN
jgi:hypothetical protein